MAEEKQECCKNEESCCKEETTIQEDVSTEACECGCKDEEQTQQQDTQEDWQMKYNELNDKYIRVYADFENSKKILEKEKYNAIDYVVEKFAKELLPCMDSLELALASANNQDANAQELLEKLKDGLGLTISQFTKALERNNLEVIDTTSGFDPNYHNAIMQVADDTKEDGEIVQVFQKGYKLKDRVLRASMVSVCKK